MIGINRYYINKNDNTYTYHNISMGSKNNVTMVGDSDDDGVEISNSDNSINNIKTDYRLVVPERYQEVQQEEEH